MAGRFLERVNSFTRREKAAIAAFYGSYWNIEPHGIYAHKKLEREQIERAANYWREASTKQSLPELTAEKREHLIQQIEDTFADDPFPDPEHVGSDLVQSFRGHWKAIPKEILRSHADALGAFTVQGFRYYIPAFLCELVRDPLGPGGLLYYLTNFLAPYRGEMQPEPDDLIEDDPIIIEALENMRKWEEVRCKRVAAFSREEKQAIHGFFVFFEEYYTQMYAEAEWAYSGSDREQRLMAAIEFWSNQL